MPFSLRSVILTAVVAGLTSMLAANRVNREREAEVTRVREHLAGAIALLESRDLTQITTSQTAQRAALIESLKDYRIRGRFPKNHRFPSPTPFFRDRDGTLCAVGHLLATTGWEDIVDRIAARRNNAYLKELIDEPGLADWLEDHGLTAAEAARIQPQYGFLRDRSKVGTAYGVASTIGVATSLASVVFNASRLGGAPPKRVWGAIGAIAGFATVMTGAPHLANGGDARVLGLIDIFSGGAALILGLDATLAKTPSRTAPAPAIRMLPTFELPRGGAGGRAGILLTARF